MSWQLMVALSVLLYSANGLLHRTIMKDENSDGYTQAFAFTLQVSIIFLIAFLFRLHSASLPSLNQLMLFLLTASLSSVGMVFTFMGFKSIGASEHTVLLTSSRLWFMLGSILILHESLTTAKLAGTLAILLGVVLAQWRAKTFVFNKGAVYVLLADLFFGASETISFSIVRNFDVVSYMTHSGLIVTLILFASRPMIIQKLSFYLKPRRALSICATSVNDSLANVFGLVAYQLGKNALQIGPIMATQTLVTVLLAIVILRERDNMAQKIAGSVFAILGTSLLI